MMRTEMKWTRIEGGEEKRVYYIMKNGLEVFALGGWSGLGLEREVNQLL